MPHQVLEHTADLRVRIFADNLAALFSEAAAAMYHQIVRTKYIDESQKTILRVSGYDLTDLMINWLRELLYFWTGRSLIVTGTRIRSLNDTMIKADIFYVRFDPGRDIVHNDIKAVTFHGAEVKKGDKGFEITVIFDV